MKKFWIEVKEIFQNIQRKWRDKKIHKAERQASNRDDTMVLLTDILGIRISKTL